ncbi:MAG: hypothetical protein JWM97_2000 [Phycisphaerales bacterium]|nr:hypothetical protein [Phycisphaerales bacterium]
MNSEERLAQISRALQDAGLTSLVMGGHAVRYYGVDRNTVDFDFFTSAPSTRDVRERLLRIELLANAREGRTPGISRHMMQRQFSARSGAGADLNGR